MTDQDTLHFAQVKRCVIQNEICQRDNVFLVILCNSIYWNYCIFLQSIVYSSWFPESSIFIAFRNVYRDCVSDSEIGCKLPFPKTFILHYSRLKCQQDLQDFQSQNQSRMQNRQIFRNWIPSLFCSFSIDLCFAKLLTNTIWSVCPTKCSEFCK